MSVKTMYIRLRVDDTKNLDFDTITDYFSINISNINYYVITFFQLNFI